MNQSSQRVCFLFLIAGLFLASCGRETPTSETSPRPSIRLSVGQFIPEEYEDELLIPDDSSTVEDAAWRCPDDPRGNPTSRPAKLGVIVGDPPDDHVVTFIFDGPKPFIKYVGMYGAWPIGEFYVEETLSEDLKWVARGPLRMACRGRYYRLPAALIWTGTFLTLGVNSVVPSNLPPGGGGGGSGGGSGGTYVYYHECTGYLNYERGVDDRWYLVGLSEVSCTSTPIWVPNGGEYEI